MSNPLVAFFFLKYPGNVITDVKKCVKWGKQERNLTEVHNTNTTHT